MTRRGAPGDHGDRDDAIVLFQPMRVELHAAAQSAYTALMRGRESGHEPLHWPTDKPLVEVRCAKGHMSARVYATPQGALFVSLPPYSKAEQENPHSGIVRTTHPRGYTEVIADLLDLEPEGPHPTLLARCRCGPMHRVDRDRLRALARDVVTGSVRRPAKFIM